MKILCSTLIILTPLLSGAAAAEDAKIPLLARKPTPQTKQTELTADEKASLMRRVQQCWNPPPGITGKVSVWFHLDRSGAVSSTPQTVRDLDNEGEKENSALAASAKRAVLKCQPYVLPAERYDSWSEVIVNFATD
jgi:hypothetical protein